MEFDVGTKKSFKSNGKSNELRISVTALLFEFFNDIGNGVTLVDCCCTQTTQLIVI